MAKNKLAGKVLIDSRTKNPSLKEFRLSEDEVAKYKPEKGTEDLVHLELEKVVWDDGEKASLPNITKIPQNAWLFMRRKLITQGFNYIRILHAGADVETRLLMDKGLYSALKNATKKRVTFNDEYVEVIDPEKGGKTLTRREAAAAAEKAAEEAKANATV